jgi:nitrous oxide reductase accessory protein NosL
VRSVGTVLVLVVALVASACSDAASANGPPEINYGRDICIECGMIIGDARFAAAYRLDDGTEKKFDDLGGLIIHGRETNELDSAQVWVSDFDDERLIDAPTAFYVPALGVVSPQIGIVLRPRPKSSTAR